MKAVVQTKSGLEVQELEKPTPSDNEVLVKVHATTVTAGDVVLQSLPRFMYWAPVRKVLGVPPRKSTPGHEFAGEVEAIGRNVRKFRIGDPVFGTTTGLITGANAEYISVPEASATGTITIKPTSLTFADASAIPIGGMTALFLLRKAKIQPGHSVLIYGASGSVGTYAVQLARYFGAEVTGVSSRRNLDLVKSLGAKKVIDYTVEDFTENEATYDVIFDAVGKPSPKKGKQVLKQDGHYVSIRSSTLESAQALDFLKELVEAGEVKPVIDRDYSLEQIKEAYQHVKSGRKTGNVIITIESEKRSSEPVPSTRLSTIHASR